VVSELADGGVSPVGGELAGEPSDVIDAAGGVDLTSEDVHGAGGQGEGVVDLGLVMVTRPTPVLHAQVRAGMLAYLRAFRLHHIAGCSNNPATSCRRCRDHPGRGSCQDGPLSGSMSQMVWWSGVAVSPNCAQAGRLW